MLLISNNSVAEQNSRFVYFLPENGAGQEAIMESGLAADYNCHKNFHDISGT
jgi:hypothetical protein